MSLEFIDSKKLSKRIAEVQKELAQLLHLESFVKPKAKRGRKPGRPAKQNKPVAKKAGKRGKRGSLGEGILKFLAPKGKEGAHVKDISAQVGKKPANVTAWFYTTGAKNKSVKKLGGNRFAYVP